jgi:uncharacterized Rossmann fold enzyme
MFFNKWEPIYKEIIKDFSFSEEKDIQAAIILDSLLKNHPHSISLSSLSSMLFNETVVVIGAGSNLLDSISKYHSYVKKHICIAADGATSALMHNKIIPNLIVTDLDGKIADQIYANEMGSVLIIHAHGDNIETIEKTIPIIPQTVCGTIQSNPQMLSFVSNVGGFTDGDRAVIICNHFQVKTCYLVGFDFHGAIGSFSFTDKKSIHTKKKKLLWAEKLISMVNTKKNIHFLP